jgi:excisionase family DNA binding protein
MTPYKGPPEVTGPPATTVLPCPASTNFPGAGEKRPSKPDFCSERKSGGRRDQSGHDRSFGQHNALPAGRRARTGLPGGGRWHDGGGHLRGTRHRAPVVPARWPALSRGRPLLAGRAPARTGAWLGAGGQGRPRARPGRLDVAAGVEGGCLRSRAAGQPAPPAGSRAGRHCPRQRRDSAGGHRPGPRRPPDPAPPHRPPVRSFPFPGFPRPAAPGRCRPWPAGRGPDLTGRAERSVRRRGPTDGPAPGTPTAPSRPPATPGADPGTADDPLLTIDEVTAELRVSRAAFYRWRRQGAGPAAVRLPGGGVRVRRSALTAWLRRLEADTRDGQEQTADGQLRRQVLGHQED